MLEFLYDDKELFRTLNPKEAELFELLLTVIDEDKKVPDSLSKDKWERIDLSERKKICGYPFNSASESPGLWDIMLDRMRS